MNNFLNEEVEKLFGHVFEQGVARDEFEKLLGKLSLIMKNQICLLISEQKANSTNFLPTYQPVFNNQNFQMPLPYGSNYSNTMMIYPPTIYPNPYGNNLHMQQIPMINQQLYAQPNLIDQNGKKGKKGKNKKNKKDKKNKKSMKNSKRKELKIEYTGEPFSGIISELTKKAGVNINDKGIIQISGNRDMRDNGTFFGTFSSIVDFNHTSRCFKTNNQQNSFICFDFLEHKITVSAYTIKSSNLTGPSCLKSWVLEGSNDSYQWEKLDSHFDEVSLVCLHHNNNPNVRTFTIQNEQRKPFRYIKLKMTGPSSLGDKCFGLTNMEFFGVYN